jgi:hypothetical protein
MNALVKPDYAAWSLSEAVVSDFMGKGAYVLGDRLNGRACAELLAEVRKGRRFDQSLFMTEADYLEGRSAARGERSLLAGLDGKLDFVERAPPIVEALWSLLGPDYRMLERAVVCLLPEAAIPAWVQRRLFASGETSLTAFVRPGLRDMSYRTAGGVRRPAEVAERADEVVSLDVYLHPVTDLEAPLHLLQGSHRLGALDAPTALKRTGQGAWRYRHPAHGEMFLSERAVVGEAGMAVLRHGWTLCGDAEGGQHERITLSYRFGRGSARTAGIDSVNASLAD